MVVEPCGVNAATSHDEVHRRRVLDFDTMDWELATNRQRIAETVL
jgi:hypothetical protein